tara:strand:- start:138 stop:545 length:408 start_codon:yes stop_codon:yes gene_type:complete
MNDYKIALGLDYGRRKMGAAIGQQRGGIPRPLPIIKMKKKAPDWQTIDCIVEEWNPEFIVFGLPTNLDGSGNKIGKEIKKLGQIFSTRYLAQVHYIDERLSSKMASERMKAGEKFSLDSIAAGLILETWFESQKK